MENKPNSKEYFPVGHPTFEQREIWKCPTCKLVFARMPNAAAAAASSAAVATCSECNVRAKKVDLKSADGEEGVYACYCCAQCHEHWAINGASPVAKIACRGCNVVSKAKFFVPRLLVTPWVKTAPNCQERANAQMKAIKEADAANEMKNLSIEAIVDLLSRSWPIDEAALTAAMTLHQKDKKLTRAWLSTTAECAFFEASTKKLGYEKLFRNDSEFIVWSFAMTDEFKYATEIERMTAARLWSSLTGQSHQLFEAEVVTLLQAERDRVENLAIARNYEQTKDFIKCDTCAKSFPPSEIRTFSCENFRGVHPRPLSTCVACERNAKASKEMAISDGRSPAPVFCNDCKEDLAKCAFCSSYVMSFRVKPTLCSKGTPKEHPVLACMKCVKYPGSSECTQCSLGQRCAKIASFLSMTSDPAAVGAEGAICSASKTLGDLMIVKPARSGGGGGNKNKGRK
jgi:hypothetical protein